MTDSIKKKVFVGLSGGVDSAVSALLLKKVGYDVTGVFIRGWQPDWIPCTWKADRISAMRTAAYLDIPFITLDLEKEYKDKVVSYLLKEYAKGNTPNPDMLCNREIKFGKFLDWALQHGADYVATGHYAELKGGELFESEDDEKDQSYFLSQLTQKELQKILFPIGGYKKGMVRKIAAEHNLPVAGRKDSQGICFVGDLEMSEFLKKELKPSVGKVINENGEEIGQHEGAILYTIGQRHGFTVYNKSEHQKNLYVVSKDIGNNTITVQSIEVASPQLKSPKNEITISNFSFTHGIFDIENASELLLRIRYRGEKHEIQFINYDESKRMLTIRSLQVLDFAHGQFGVLYDGKKCLGGGEL